MQDKNLQVKVKPGIKHQAFSVLTGRSDEFLSVAQAGQVLGYNKDYSYNLSRKVRTEVIIPDKMKKRILRCIMNLAIGKPMTQSSKQPTIAESQKAQGQILPFMLPKKQEIDINEKKTIAFVDLTRYVGYKSDNMITNEVAQQQLIELPKDTPDTQTDE